MELLILTAMLGLLATVVVRLRRRAPKPRPPIASLRPGWAEVRGRARSGGPGRRAPISGRECLGWAVRIEHETGVHGWATLLDVREFDDFELEDETGSIPVRAANSPIVIGVAELRGRAGPFDPLPGVVARMIMQIGEPPRGVLFNKGYRWREWALVDGREVVVRGRVVSEPGADSVSYRRMSEILVLAGGAAHPLEVDE